MFGLNFCCKTCVAAKTLSTYGHIGLHVSAINPHPYASESGWEPTADMWLLEPIQPRGSHFPWFPNAYITHTILFHNSSLQVLRNTLKPDGIHHHDWLQANLSHTRITSPMPNHIAAHPKPLLNQAYMLKCLTKQILNPLLSSNLILANL